MSSVFLDLDSFFFSFLKKSNPNWFAFTDASTHRTADSPARKAAGSRAGVEDGRRRLCLPVPRAAGARAVSAPVPAVS